MFKNKLSLIAVDVLFGKSCFFKNTEEINYGGGMSYMSVLKVHNLQKTLLR